MKPTHALNTDEAFFFKHAGYSHDPKIESQAQGRTRCAVALADAEQRYLNAHRVGEAVCEWSDDPDGAYDLRHDKVCFETCESCCILDGNGGHLASLHAITDATPEYRRVVRAELACEAFPIGA